MTYQQLTLPGGLSGLYRPSGNSQCLMVLAHGAGAGHDHQHMTQLADCLAAAGIGSLRFNFPFMQSNKRRVDNQAICEDTFSRIIDEAIQLEPEASLLLGGHSFGGRMATHFLASHKSRILGLVCFSFPLHPSKKPDTKRAAHLADVSVPMLFVSGDRDTLAERHLMDEVVAALPEASLHWIETADHSFRILKRTRQSAEDVYAETARVVSLWLENLPGR